jgi:phosphate uptake regulator
VRSYQISRLLVTRSDTFLEWRQLLERDDEIRRRYDDLKRRFEGGSMEAYREAKARFIADCLGMRDAARSL